MSATNPSVNHYGAVTGQPNVYYPGRSDAKPKRNVPPVYASSVSLIHVIQVYGLI